MRRWGLSAQARAAERRPPPARPLLRARRAGVAPLSGPKRAGPRGVPVGHPRRSPGWAGPAAVPGGAWQPRGAAPESPSSARLSGAGPSGALPRRDGVERGAPGGPGLPAARCRHLGPPGPARSHAAGRTGPGTWRGHGEGTGVRAAGGRGAPTRERRVSGEPLGSSYSVRVPSARAVRPCGAATRPPAPRHLPARPALPAPAPPRPRGSRRVLPPLLPLPPPTLRPRPTRCPGRRSCGRSGDGRVRAGLRAAPGLPRAAPVRPTRTPGALARPARPKPSRPGLGPRLPTTRSGMSSARGPRPGWGRRRPQRLKGTRPTARRKLRGCGSHVTPSTIQTNFSCLVLGICASPLTVSQQEKQEQAMSPANQPTVCGARRAPHPPRQPRGT